MMVMPLGKRKRLKRAHGEGGFTLIEILVVIAIIALIMSLVGPRVLNYLGESKVKAAKIQIQSFGSALDLFNLDTGRYPSSAGGLPPLGHCAGEGGFTLIEVVCVLAIIALVAAILLPEIPRGTSRSRLQAYALEIAT